LEGVPSRNVTSTLKKLRPAKVRTAVRRRLFERRLERLPAARAPGVVKMGSKPGGWMIPRDLVGQGWLCYCGGIGGDISFDLELIERYDVTVRAFDPVAGYVEDALEKSGGEPRFSAYRAAIAVEDGPVRMQVTHEQGSRSVSLAGLYDTNTLLELPGRSLPSLMEQLNDSHVDLLKLDLEGAEYELLPTLDLHALGVKIFSTQMHHTGSVREAKSLITRLSRDGYELIGRTPAVKLTFAREDLLA
jgi:FkbM family methyltransferase